MEQEWGVVGRELSYFVGEGAYCLAGEDPLCLGGVHGWEHVERVVP